MIGAEAWAELRACFSEKRFLARPEAVPGRFAALWSDWEFEAICRFTTLVEADTFRMVTRGKQIPSAAYRGRESGARVSIVRQLWESGASINFARLELYSNRVLALMRGLEAELQCPLRVHYFATPAQGQALGVHADHADALILQVRGEKTWDVYPGSNDWPNDPAVAVDLLRRHPPQTLTLGPGGWLFLPKGVYHEVRNTGTAPSIHFTLGLHPLTWGILLEQALEFARGDPALREKVALADAMEAVTSRTEAQLAGLRPHVLRAFAAGHYGERMPTSELVPATALADAGPSTRFRWRSDAARPRSYVGGLEIDRPYRSVPLTLRQELAAALAHMAGGREYTVAELPVTAEVGLPLCRFLASVGVLELVAPKG